MNDSVSQIIICIFLSFFFILSAQIYNIFDSHNKRTSDNILSVIIIHELGRRKPSFSVHARRSAKARTAKWSNIPVIFREQFDVC